VQLINTVAVYYKLIFFSVFQKKKKKKLLSIIEYYYLNMVIINLVYLWIELYLIKNTYEKPKNTQSHLTKYISADYAIYIYIYALDNKLRLRLRKEIHVIKPITKLYETQVMRNIELLIWMNIFQNTKLYETQFHHFIIVLNFTGEFLQRRYI